MNGTELLNALQRKTIEIANARGIILADEFASVPDFKRFIFALGFKLLKDEGYTTADAFDILAGERGAFDNMAETIYNGLQA